MDSLLHDLRFAVRSLRRAPGFTIAAIVALGLGTGSAAAVFSMLDGVVLRPLPYAQPDRLVMLWETNQAKGLQHEQLSPVNFVDYRALGTVFSDAAAWWVPQLNLTDEESGEPARVTAVETSGNLFAVLGVRPLVGAGFANDTAMQGTANEAVISHRLWSSRFGGNRSVIGKAVRLNGSAYTIVGVMPPGFTYPGETDLWERLGWNLSQHSRGAHFMEAVGRLRPGVPVEQANRELATLGSRLAGEFRGTNAGWSVRAVPLDTEVVGVFRPALFALLGASGLLLVIACINVANLLLARATARQREVAVRAAIGASRRRLVRLFLTESVVLALAGALLGLAVAVAGVKGFLAWTPIHVPRAAGVGVNVTVLVFALAVAMLTALAFGLAPAILMSRAELQDSLKEGARGSGGAGARARNTLVIAEVALAVILLSGSGLLIRSVAHLLEVSSGLDPTSVLTVDLQLPGRSDKDWDKVDQFYTSLVTALRARPEVVGAGAGNFLPLEAGWRLPFTIVGAAPVPRGDEPTAQAQVVDEGFFGALRVPIVRGRSFEAHDDAASPAVVIANEALARQIFPGQNAVGQRLTLTVRQIGPLGKRVVAGDDHEIIGVVRDIKNTSLKTAAEPAIYFPERQFPYKKMHLVVRGRGDAAQLAGIVRDEVRRIDPTLPLGDVKTMQRVLAESVDAPRFLMLLMTAFATLALTLASVGIYGILTYMVNHRGREIGIRVALGAAPLDMLRMIVQQGVVLALVGCAIGLGGAYVAGRALASFLFGVAPWDPLTLAGVVAVVMMVVLVACLIPGRRASLADPVAALRGEG